MLAAWWRERPPRERAILIGGGAALVLVVFYLLLEPRLEERGELAAEIPQLREDLTWMQRNLEKAKRLRGLEREGRPQDRERPVTPAMVEESLRASGLAKRLDALRPSGSQGVQVAFKEVPFPDLASWLRDLGNG